MSGLPYCDIIGEVTFPTKGAMDEFFALARDCRGRSITPETTHLAFAEEGGDDTEVDGFRITWTSTSEKWWGGLVHSRNSRILAKVGATARIKIIPEDRDYDVEVVVIKNGVVDHESPMSDEELFYALLELCQQHGMTNDYTNEMLRNAVDSIVKEER